MKLRTLFIVPVAVVAMMAAGTTVVQADTGHNSVRPAATTTTLLPVNVGAAGSFAVLSKSGVSDVPNSKITGDVGTSPITGAAITGLTCAEVTGTIYSVNAAGPLRCRVTAPSTLTTAISNMEAAYTRALGVPRT